MESDDEYNAPYAVLADLMSQLVTETQSMTGYMAQINAARPCYEGLSARWEEATRAGAVQARHRTRAPIRPSLTAVTGVRNRRDPVAPAKLWPGRTRAPSHDTDAPPNDAFLLMGDRTVVDHVGPVVDADTATALFAPPVDDGLVMGDRTVVDHVGPVVNAAAIPATIAKCATATSTPETPGTIATDMDITATPQNVADGVSNTATEQNESVASKPTFQSEVGDLFTEQTNGSQSPNQASTEPSIATRTSLGSNKSATLETIVPTQVVKSSQKREPETDAVPKRRSERFRTTVVPLHAEQGRTQRISRAKPTIQTLPSKRRRSEPDRGPSIG